MLLVRPRHEQSRRRLPQFMGPGGYAVPREPIRVVLARDEEVAGVTNGAAKNKPPAYGLWRESVVSFQVDSIMKERMTNVFPRELIRIDYSGSAMKTRRSRRRAGLHLLAPRVTLDPARHRTYQTMESTMSWKPSRGR